MENQIQIEVQKLNQFIRSDEASKLDEDCWYDFMKENCPMLYQKTLGWDAPSMEDYLDSLGVVFGW